MKFQLKYSEVVQGEPDWGELNLMMVMQVNCPGCFLNGIPQMNRLHRLYRKQLSFFFLATAFEDFDLNTIENAKRLVQQGILVGETEKAFRSHNLIWDQASLAFPLLVDAMLDKVELTKPTFPDSIVSTNPQFMNISKTDLNEVKDALQNYFNSLDRCGFTFAANLLQGTPTFVLFNRNMELLLQWFGHRDDKLVAEALGKFLY